MPDARYAKSGDVNIAYVTVGDGPVNLVWVPTWISQCEYLFEEPSVAAAFERLGEFATVAVFDRRGSGLSDPMAGAPTLEEQMDDVLAVMGAAGFERAAVSATIEGGPMGTLFAATHPDRCEGLVLYAAFARSQWAPDYDWTWKPAERDARSGQIVEHWGEGWMAGSVAASRQGDPAFHEVGRPAGAAGRQPGDRGAFTDICRSTERAAEMGDRAWRNLLTRHDDLIRRELARHRGREIKHTGDGFLATFDGPARGLRCASAIREGVKGLGR